MTAPVGYLGQLSAQWQAQQRALRRDIRPEDGHWYHESALPDGRHVRGAWNLIDREHEYLGGVEVAGRRVLELGPATGHLSVWLEMQGADLVVFDAGLDHCIDLLPYDAIDLDGPRAVAMRLIGQVQNSWWWLTGQWGVDVPAVYGNIYDLPGDLGDFDLSVFAAILLHLRDPYAALAQVARRTREQIVVTDAVPAGLVDWDADWAEFNPIFGDQSSWWRLSPQRIVRMLATMGFADVELRRHVQYIRPRHDVDLAFEPVQFYSVVATRTAPALPE